MAEISSSTNKKEFLKKLQMTMTASEEEKDDKDSWGLVRAFPH